MPPPGRRAALPTRGASEVEFHLTKFDENILIARRAANDCVLSCFNDRGGGIGAHEPHFVAGLELAELPEIVARHHCRTDETAERRPVRAEQIGMSPVKSRADGIGIIVDIGGMQSRLAAIQARPFRFGANQAHAGSGGIVVHFVRGREKRVDVVLPEEIRRAVRPVADRKLPVVRKGRALERRCLDQVSGRAIEAQRIARLRAPPRGRQSRQA